jgi:hypothetical protein
MLFTETLIPPISTRRALAVALPGVIGMLFVNGTFVIKNDRSRSIQNNWKAETTWEVRKAAQTSE